MYLDNSNNSNTKRQSHWNTTKVLADDTIKLFIALLYFVDKITNIVISHSVNQL